MIGVLLGMDCWLVIIIFGIFVLFCVVFVVGIIFFFMVLLKFIDFVVDWIGFVVEFIDSVVFECDVDEDVGLDGVVVVLCVE